MRYASVTDLPQGLREQAQRKLTQQQGSRTPRAQRAATATITSPAKPAARKYRNVRVHLEGESFDSQLEYQLFGALTLRQRAGEIAWFIRQVPFRLEGGVVYRADYLAVLTAGGVEVWDAKGKDTQASINKRRQVKARYGVEVRLWTKAEK